MRLSAGCCLQVADEFGLVGPVTALAQVECSIGPKQFTDLLNLVYIEGRWQIIAKVFHYDIAAQQPNPPGD